MQKLLGSPPALAGAGAAGGGGRGGLKACGPGHGPPRCAACPHKQPALLWHQPLNQHLGPHSSHAARPLSFCDPPSDSLYFMGILQMPTGPIPALPPEESQAGSWQPSQTYCPWGPGTALTTASVSLHPLTCAGKCDNPGDTQLRASRSWLAMGTGLVMETGLARPRPPAGPPQRHVQDNR